MPSPSVCQATWSLPTPARNPRSWCTWLQPALDVTLDLDRDGPPHLAHFDHP
ncbi:hypothetical protein [Kitasatospora sp. NPDC098663]|uniref:hypothetical protein n=1 Tax=Kitasatospora sp. NPDC098663 TaxID=3364096 RepID=UPI003800A00D